MTIEAVVFDVGGVLEYVDDTSWLDGWAGRLGLSRDEVSARMDRVDPHGLIPIGELTEPQYTERYRDLLGLDHAQCDQFMADMWDWYCGELDTELCEYVATLRPAYRTAILSNSADGARREEEARFGFEQLSTRSSTHMRWVSPSPIRASMT